MRTWCILLMLTLLQVGLAWPAAFAQQARPALGFAAYSEEELGTQQDLTNLWRLTLENNPLLREAQADVDAARGRRLQAGKYPNPHFVYQQDTIGSRIAQSGNQSLPRFRRKSSRRENAGSIRPSPDARPMPFPSPSSAIASKC